MPEWLPRRLVTVPAIALGLWLVVALFPLLLLLGLLIDLGRLSRTFSTTRLAVFLVAYLAIENVALVLLLGTWLTTRAGTRARLDATFRAQRRYTGLLLAAVTRAFALRFVVEGSELAAHGPLLVFARHASLIDVLVPGGFIANVHHLELRYVLKRELLVDPALDIAGHWIPNHFVDRGGSDTQRELAAIAKLKDGLGPREGVLLYPEGTRFSRRRREAAIARLSGPARARAEELQHLLPIRPGGALTLLATPPACDVLFVGHHGLEGFTRLGDIWRGALIGRTVTIKFWRVPASEIPEGDDARLAWLHQHWRTLDQWLEAFP